MGSISLAVILTIMPFLNEHIIILKHFSSTSQTLRKEIIIVHLFACDLLFPFVLFIQINTIFVFVHRNSGKYMILS